MGSLGKKEGCGSHVEGGGGQLINMAISRLLLVKYLLIFVK